MNHPTEHQRAAFWVGGWSRLQQRIVVNYQLDHRFGPEAFDHIVERYQIAATRWTISNRETLDFWWNRD